MLYIFYLVTVTWAVSISSITYVYMIDMTLYCSGGDDNTYNENMKHGTHTRTAHIFGYNQIMSVDILDYIITVKLYSCVC